MEKEKYYHYSYQVQELGETINGNVTYGSTQDEATITNFIKGDVEDTFPDGAILSLALVAITDETGKRI